MIFKVMDTMETGIAETCDCHYNAGCPANSLLTDRFDDNFPSEEDIANYFANTTASPAPVCEADTTTAADAGMSQLCFQGVEAVQSTDTGVFAQSLHDGGPAQICVTEDHASLLPALKTFYLARSLREPHSTSRSLLSFAFSVS